ncbi:MAG TPA: RNA-processing protein [Thermoplasmatales archaeon]|nr:RNA-processing protein [Thermoplasmata archaeon]HEB37094.1 RNA-processing protein [Thermoplasmatales archaeon]HEC87370.1 RNA-processing protein [Thermoplasmatales archaeon]
MRYVKIPKERIGVLIGHDGKVKREIEKRSNTRLQIDSKLGEVQIDDSTIDDPLLALKIENIVRAIGRGFSPEHAFALFSDDAYFLLFDLRDYVGKKDTHMRRVKARIIGRNGRTKRILENMTDSFISVYGHTVCVITDMLYLDVIKTAIEMIISGSKHDTVYRYLQRKKKEIEFESFER